MVDKIDKDLLRSMEVGQSVKCKLPFNIIVSVRNMASQVKKECGRTKDFTCCEIEDGLLEITRTL